MKTFIFLSILIVAIFSYIFLFQEPQGSEPRTKPAVTPVTPTLESIEAVQEEQKPAAKPATAPKTVETEPSTILSPTQERLDAIPEDDTFERLKKILQSLRPHYRYRNITLNTPISWFLHTEKDKKAFIDAVATEFHLSDEAVEKGIQKNRILWDWVNQLR